MKPTYIDLQAPDVVVQLRLTLKDGEVVCEEDKLPETVDRLMMQTSNLLEKVLILSSKLGELEALLRKLEQSTDDAKFKRFLERLQ